MIETQDLFRVYAGDEGTAVALRGLDLSVERGEIVVIFGPSGSGKTTLLRLVSGLEAPSAGRIRVLGRDLRRLSGRRLDRFRATEIGYADQHYARLLPPDLGVRQSIELPLALAGAEKPVRRRRAAELLDQIGLTDRADARPSELSGGEQQRVALCSAIARRPRLLLADEPTGELDDASAAVTYRLIKELVKENGTTALIVSHDRGSTAIADRIVQIRDGQLAAETSRDGEDALVVGRGGWVRLPEDFLARSRINVRATPTLSEDGVLLTPAGTPLPIPVEPQAGKPVPRRGSSEAAAELRAVTKRFGRGATARTVISGLTAAFSRGRLTAVTGRSGSGKTTILHLLAGLELPSSGDVDVLGTPVSHLDRVARASFRRDQVGLVAQDPPLIPFLSSRENVELALETRGHQGNHAEEADRSLGAVGILELAGQPVSRLSMGERQRVAIARAIAASPALLLADEPTARLDHANAVAVGELLSRLVDELGITVVYSTHDEVLLQIADDVLPL